MSRDLSGDMVTEFTGPIIRPFFLFEGTFASSTLRLCDRNIDLPWNSQTWLGNGWWRGMSDVKEDNETNSKGIDVYLSGVPLALISLILSEQRHTARGSVWVGCLDADDEISAEPYLLFEGGLSSPRITDGPETADIVLSYEDDLVAMQKSKELRYNHEAQQSIYAGDRGFEYVAGLQDWKGFWGNKTKPVPPDPPRRKDKGRRR